MWGKRKDIYYREITTKAKFAAKKIARKVLDDVGYTSKYKIIDNIGKQSPDIALGTRIIRVY